MTPHPDFEALVVPRSFTLGDYHLDILTAEDLEADYEAVTRSASVLHGLFGPDWPMGLSLEDNRTDLHWHHREFTTNRSFAWVIRDPDQTYLGCAYLFPAPGARGMAEATYWMAHGSSRLSHLATFGPLYETWVTALLPGSTAITFRSNASLQASQ
jgi:hypothetical protein